MRVASGQGWVILRQLKTFAVRVRVMLDDALANPRQMKKTVHQVGAEVEVQLPGSDGVTIPAESLERHARGERERANNRLLSRVFSTPVASPACIIVTSVQLYGLALFWAFYRLERSFHQCRRT